MFREKIVSQQKVVAKETPYPHRHDQETDVVEYRHDLRASLKPKMFPYVLGKDYKYKSQS